MSEPRVEFEPSGRFQPPPPGRRRRSFDWTFCPAPLPPRSPDPLRLARGSARLVQSLATLPTGNRASGGLAGGAVCRHAAEIIQASGARYARQAHVEVLLDLSHRAPPLPPAGDAGAFCDYLLTLHALVRSRLRMKCRIAGLRTEGNIVLNAHFGRENLLLASPEPDRLPALVDNLAAFADPCSGTNPLWRAIVANYQVIVTQPFFDGNSRVAALLMEALLRRDGVIGPEPLPVRIGVETMWDQIVDSLYLVLRCGRWGVYYDCMVTALVRAIEVLARFDPGEAGAPGHEP